MVFLSLALKARANRLVNIIAGLVYMGVLGSTIPVFYRDRGRPDHQVATLTSSRTETRPI